MSATARPEAETRAAAHSAMLAALKDIMAWYDKDDGSLVEMLGQADENIAMFDRARAAIALAEGEAP